MLSTACDHRSISCGNNDIGDSLSLGGFSDQGINRQIATHHFVHHGGPSASFKTADKSQSLIEQKALHNFLFPAQVAHSVYRKKCSKAQCGQENNEDGFGKVESRFVRESKHGIPIGIERESQNGRSWSAAHQLKTVFSSYIVAVG